MERRFFCWSQPTSRGGAMSPRSTEKWLILPRLPRGIFEVSEIG